VKIILNEDVYNLGEEGDVCEVAAGYARNFLLPHGHAVVFNRQNEAVFAHKKVAIEKRKEEKKKIAQGLKLQLENLTLTLKMPAGETGKLFGSVNNAVIAEALEKEGIIVERKKIDVASTSIKNIGTYPVLIKLYSGEAARIEVIVASTDGKAEAAMAKKLDTSKAKSQKPAAEEEFEEDYDVSEGAFDDEPVEETVEEETVEEDSSDKEE
jgi:large subunit ribosomal protein L9